MRLGEEKKQMIDDRKIEITGQKYNGPLLHRVAITTVILKAASEKINAICDANQQKSLI